MARLGILLGMHWACCKKQKISHECSGVTHWGSRTFIVCSTRLRGPYFLKDPGCSSFPPGFSLAIASSSKWLKLAIMPVPSCRGGLESKSLWFSGFTVGEIKWKGVRKDFGANQQYMLRGGEIFTSSKIAKDVLSKCIKNFCTLKSKIHATQ